MRTLRSRFYRRIVATDRLVTGKATRTRTTRWIGKVALVAALVTVWSLGMAPAWAASAESRRIISRIDTGDFAFGWTNQGWQDLGYHRYLAAWYYAGPFARPTAGTVDVRLEPAGNGLFYIRGRFPDGRERELNWASLYKDVLGHGRRSAAWTPNLGKQTVELVSVAESDNNYFIRATFDDGVERELSWTDQFDDQKNSRRVAVWTPSRGYQQVWVVGNSIDLMSKVDNRNFILNWTNWGARDLGYRRYLAAWKYPGSYGIWLDVRLEPAGNGLVYIRGRFPGGTERELNWASLYKSVLGDNRRSAAWTPNLGEQPVRFVSAGGSNYFIRATFDDGVERELSWTGHFDAPESTRRVAAWTPNLGNQPIRVAPVHLKVD